MPKNHEYAGSLFSGRSGSISSHISCTVTGTIDVNKLHSFNNVCKKFHYLIFIDFSTHKNFNNELFPDYGTCVFIHPQIHTI